jgi:hypothetical protein
MRMRGEGEYAEHLSRLFAVAKRQAGLTTRRLTLSASAFRCPHAQMELFV